MVNYIRQNDLGTVEPYDLPAMIAEEVANAPAPGSFPSGGIILSLSNCPPGFSEVVSLAGKFVLGTTEAAADAGGTGGSDNITPAGSVAAPTFTGDAFTSVINHTHSVTDPGHTHVQNAHTHIQDPHSHGMAEGQTDGAGTLMDRSNAASATTTTTDAATATNQSTTAVNQSATTGITTQNPAGGVASITPTGTNSAPAFTGTQFDNRPAFVKVVFCQKD